VFALKQQNLDVLKEKADGVSTPSSGMYTQYMSVEEVRALVAPPVGVVEVVKKWVEEETGYTPTLTSSRDFLTLYIPRTTAERLLHVTFQPFTHPSLPTHRPLYRALDHYTVPAHIAPYLDFIGGVNRFPRPRDVRESEGVVDVRGRMSSMSGLRGMSGMSGMSGDVTSPVIVKVYPSDATMRVYLQPRCLDGSVTNDAVHLCSDRYPPANVTDILIHIAYGTVITTDGRNLRTLPITEFDCRACAQWGGLKGTCDAYNDTAAIFCLSPLVSGLPNYVQLSVTAATRFEESSRNGSVSAFSLYGGPPLFLGQFMSPLVLKKRYGVPEALIGTNPNNTMAVAEFLDQFYSNTDLDNFMASQGLPTASQLVTVYGPNN